MRLIHLLAACVMALTVGTANANTLTTFDASGNYLMPSGTSISGTLGVDVTAGAITNVNLTVTGYSTFTDLLFTQLEPAGGSVPARVYLNIENSTGNILGLFLNTTSSYLVGYNGGSILDAGAQCILCNPPTFPIGLNGTLTAEVSATPLPAALPLFAGGLGALGLLNWRKKRKAAALAA
jgi:hypothetical protein